MNLDEYNYEEAQKIIRLVPYLVTDKHGNVAIVQFPNTPLILWLLLVVVAEVIVDSTTKGGVVFVRDAMLFTWSYLEIRSGSSPFRRVLGSIVMIGLLLEYIT